MTIGEKMRIAATKFRGIEKNIEYKYPLCAPKIPAGVVPKGGVAPVLAMDYNASSYFDNQIYSGFPGFSYLAQLATRPEYRAMASTYSTETTRKWIKFTSKQSDGKDSSEKIKLIEKEFKRLGIKEVIQLIAEHDCLFGRGQIFIKIKNNEDKNPLILDPRTIPVGSLERVCAVEAMWTTPSSYNAIDPSAPDFYKPSSWFMLGREVHASRLLTVVTRKLPDMLKPAFNFAGISLSQLAEPYVDNWLRTRQSVSDLINNFSITCLATAMDQLLQPTEGGDDLFARADLFTATRSNRGIMLLDKEREELQQINTPLSGLHELQAQAQEHMCSTSKIPAIILTGISPSGLNASSEGEIRIFYDWINAGQEAFYREPIEIILKIVQLSLFGEIDHDIGFSFVPLYQMTPEQEADIKLKNSQTDTNYVQSGVLDPSEIRDRLAKSEDSGYLGIDVDGIEMNENEAEDESTSEAQHNAMEAAAHGKSTLGIPQSVGKEFVKKDENS